ncbi:MAG: hypothetical protein ACE5LH_07645 [Fidelibacterota bacterium]
MIEVKQKTEGDPLEFHVTVREGDTETHHQVTMSESTYRKLTAGRVTPVRCIRAAFEFLLEREPKEAILRSFDVTVISRYFPAFESEFGTYLSG